MNEAIILAKSLHELRKKLPQVQEEFVISKQQAEELYDKSVERIFFLLLKANKHSVFKVINLIVKHKNLEEAEKIKRSVHVQLRLLELLKSIIKDNIDIHEITFNSDK